MVTKTQKAARAKFVAMVKGKSKKAAGSSKAKSSKSK